MEHYEFPEIYHIDDIKIALDGREEINVNQRDGFQVVDYAYCLPDTFPPIPSEFGKDRDIAILRRECRGLLFHSNGDLLRRSFHKFHNMGEREETLPQNIDFTKPHVILDKLDGSMISPYVIGDKLFYGTMFGNTDVAKGAEEFVQESDIDYDWLSIDLINGGWTPIYEWCSLKNRVVIRHEQPKLILTAIRNNNTGCYKTYNEVVNLARYYNIPVVESFGSVTGKSEDFMKRIHDESGKEGYVVRFDNGHAVKIKCDWYVRLHGAIESLVYEKDVLSLIIHDNIDDVIPVLMDGDRDHLIDYQHSLYNAIDELTDLLEHQVSDMKALSGGDNKKYAELVKSNDNLIGYMKGMAFRMNSGHPVVELIREYIIRATYTASKVEEMRKIIKVKPW